MVITDWLQVDLAFRWVQLSSAHIHHNTVMMVSTTDHRHRHYRVAVIEFGSMKMAHRKAFLRMAHHMISLTEIILYTFISLNLIEQVKIATKGFFHNLKEPLIALSFFLFFFPTYTFPYDIRKKVFSYFAIVYLSSSFCCMLYRIRIS